MGNKFSHVRHAVLDPTNCHECLWPGCVQQIPRQQLMCKSHWLTLPKLIRDRVWSAYEVGQEADARLVSAEYQDAASAARKWAESFLAANANVGFMRKPGECRPAAPGARRRR
jgi:hypothetical protein